MKSVGWETLEQWGDDVARIEPLTGGVGVNEVWSVRVNGHLAIGRLVVCPVKIDRNGVFR